MSHTPTPAVAERLECSFFTTARTRLGDERWAAAYATGREWTPAKALSAACADPLAPDVV
jgi:hypothetical protein